MVRARFETEADLQRLTLTGHATGDPAVCAAASALVYALVGWLCRRRAAGLVFRLEPGDAAVSCRREAAADTAFQVALAGLELLGKSCPERLCLETEEKEEEQG